MAHRPNRTRWLRRSLRQAPRLPSRDESPESSALAKTQIARINEISLMARTTWFGLLAYLTFVGITLLGVEDADFFVPSRQTQLPLVNVSIPTADFFAFAPVLGAALYVYLHIQLLKLWEALATPDPVIAGRPLAEHVYPWLINDFALTHRRDGAIKRRPLVFLSNTVTVLLVWIAGPFVLAGFWIRSMPAHNEWLTLFIALCLGTAVYVGLTTWWRASKSLRRVEGTPWSGWWKRPMGIALLFVTVVLSWVTTEGGFDHYANRLVTAWNDARSDDWMRTCALRIRIEDGQEDPAPPKACLDWKGQQRDVYADEEGRRDAGEIDWIAVQERHVADRWWGFSMERLTFDTRDKLFGFVFGEDENWTPLAPTNLAGVELVPKPANWRDYQTVRRRFRESWCKQQGLNLEVCARIHGASEPAPDHLKTLRNDWCTDDRRGIPADKCEGHFATLDDQFLEAWKEESSVALALVDRLDLSGRDLRGADLSGAFLASVDLSGARMEGADLRLARMEGAVLRRARMERADLSWARMEGAVLWQARMEGAVLSEARMEGAVLIEARMEGAVLWRARMEGAVLIEARMEGAVLWRARMEGANLVEARMERANLVEARMEGADLSEARMEGAVLSGARMEGADLSGARMEGADLSGARMEGADLRLARMEGAVLSGARMEGAVLSGARMEGADLSEARMEGADLSEARMEDSECTSAAFLAALVHSADVNCRNLTQGQLQYTVGNAGTRLAPGLHVWSCLDRRSLSDEAARQIEAALAPHPKDRGLLRVSRADFEQDLFCDPTNPNLLRRDPYQIPPPVGRPH